MLRQFNSLMRAEKFPVIFQPEKGIPGLNCPVLQSFSHYAMAQMGLKSPKFPVISLFNREYHLDAGCSRLQTPPFLPPAAVVFP